MAEEKVGIKIETDTRSLRTQFKEAMQELAKLQNQAGATSKEISQAARKAAELKDRIGDAKDTIDAFNPDAKFRAFGQSIAGVAGAFSAAQGALSLFGIESENVQKQILKVQSALALSEGLNTIIGSIDGFKNLALVIKTQVVEAFATLKGAIIASGLGVLAITLSAGYYLWNQYAEGIENVRKKLKQLQEDTARGAKAQKEAELEALDRLKKNAINEAKLKGAKEEEINAIEQKFAKLRVKTLTRLLEEVRGNSEAEKEFAKELLKSKDEYNQLEVDGQIKKNELKLAKQKEYYDLSLKQDQEYADAQHQKFLDYEAEEAKRYENRISDATKAKPILDKIAEQTAKNQEIRLSKLDKKIQESGSKEIKIAEATAKQKVALAGDVLGILSGFAEQGTDLQKGLALAQVAVDTGIAISNMTATSSAPTADNIASGGLSGFAKYATGIIKILANIATAKNIINSVPGGSGGVSIGTPSIDTSAPVYPTYIPPQATTLDQKSLNTISNVVARAYVVESDITGVTKRVQRIENAARF